MNLKHVFDAILKGGHYVRRSAPGGEAWSALSMQFGDETWELFMHESDAAACVISHVGYNFRASYYGTADDRARWNKVVKERREIYEAGVRAFEKAPPEMKFALIYGMDSDKLLAKMFPEKTKEERDSLRDAVGFAFPEVRRVLKGFDAAPEQAPIFTRAHLVTHGISFVPRIGASRYQVLRGEWRLRSGDDVCLHSLDRFAVVLGGALGLPDLDTPHMICANCGKVLCGEPMGPGGPCIKEPNHHGAHGDLFRHKAQPSKMEVLFGSDPIPLHPTDSSVAVHRKAVLRELDAARDREPYQISKPLSDEDIINAAHSARNERTDRIAAEFSEGPTWEELGRKEGDDEPTT